MFILLALVAVAAALFFWLSGHEAESDTSSQTNESSSERSAITESPSALVGRETPAAQTPRPVLVSPDSGLARSPVLDAGDAALDAGSGAYARAAGDRDASSSLDAGHEVPLGTFDLDRAPGFPVGVASARFERLDGKLVSVQIAAGGTNLCTPPQEGERWLNVWVSHVLVDGQVHPVDATSPGAYALMNPRGRDFYGMVWFELQPPRPERFLVAEAASEEGEVTLTEVDSTRVSGWFRARMTSDQLGPDGRRGELGWFSGTFNAAVCGADAGP